MVIKGAVLGSEAYFKCAMPSIAVLKVPKRVTDKELSKKLISTEAAWR